MRADHELRTMIDFSPSVAAVGPRGADEPRLCDAPLEGDLGRELARRQGRHQLQDDARGVAECRGGWRKTARGSERRF